MTCISFSQKSAPLYSAKIMRNKHTSSSFGYGFVNFVKKEDADRAIEVKDGEKVLHKQIRVAHSRRGEGPEVIKNANLFVGNLPLSWKEADLERAFKQHGKVIKCKVLIDQLTGVSRGCGFVLYSKTAEAESAIKEIDGKKLTGCEKPLVVKRNNLQEEATKSKSNVGSLTSAKEVHVIHHYNPYPMGYSSAQQNPHHRRPPHQSPAFTAAPFSSEKYAHPYHPFHPPHHVPHSSHGPAHHLGATAAKSPLYVYDPFGGGVSYATMGHVAPLAALPHISPVANGRMGVHSMTTAAAANQRSSSGPSTQSPGSTLFVYNIGPECTELDLYQLFGPYGAITNTRVQREPSSGKGKGFGFVTYSSHEGATLAIANLHGYAWEKNEYRTLQVSFKTSR